METAFLMLCDLRLLLGELTGAAVSLRFTSRMPLNAFSSDISMLYRRNVNPDQDMPITYGYAEVWSIRLGADRAKRLSAKIPALGMEALCI